jgi:prophage tail gpP-like protein
MSLVLKINDRFRNRKVDFFNDFSFNLKYDSVGSTFGFNFYFNPLNIEHKELACVTHFHEVQLLYNDELLVTGVLTSQNFKQSTKKKLSSFGGYSKPGILEDCQIPTSLYPLQSDNLSLKEIAEKLIRPFKLGLVIDPAVASKMNKTFKTSTASERSTIKDYLTELASQKDIIMSHDENGNLLFTEAKTNITPILEFDLTKENPIGTDFELDFDGQNMHSHITLQKQASIDGGNSGEYTIRNPYVIGSYYRPKVKSQSSGDDNETALAARRELGNELKGVKLTVTTDSWVVDGKLLKPNNIISLYAPELYIYRKTNWFIESINFTGNNSEQTAVLNCVLPEVYNKEKPLSIFREINLHALDE